MGKLAHLCKGFKLCGHFKATAEQLLRPHLTHILFGKCLKFNVNMDMSNILCLKHLQNILVVFYKAASDQNLVWNYLKLVNFM